MFEKDLEIQKINLSLREDFNLIDAFGMLDHTGKGHLNPTELHIALRDLDIPVTQEDCYLLFLRFNRDMDGVLKYSEFTDAFMPIDQHYARQLGCKRLQYSNPNSSFCKDTFRHYGAVWAQMARTESTIEQMRCKLKRRLNFDIELAFRTCDQGFSGYVTFTDVSTHLNLTFPLHFSLKI